LICADVLLAFDLDLAGRALKGSSTWLSRDELIQITVTRKAEKTTQAATIPKMMTAMVSSIIVLLSCCQTRCWPWIKLTKTARKVTMLAPAQAVGDHAAVAFDRNFASLSFDRFAFLCCTWIIRFSNQLQ
jgi:hypothetical protein